jgi:hypothetical protein
LGITNQELNSFRLWSTTPLQSGYLGQQDKMKIIYYHAKLFQQTAKQALEVGVSEIVAHFALHLISKQGNVQFSVATKQTRMFWLGMF